MVASQQYANSSQDAVIVGAYLVELRNGAFRLIHFAGFQICLSQQV